MTATEAEKVLSIFKRLLKSLKTTVFLVSGKMEERLILRKTLPSYYALCSWPLPTVSGFLPYSLALEDQAIGCRHSLGVTATDLYVCIAAPNSTALHQALRCLRETNDLFQTAGEAGAPPLQVWLKGFGGRLVEIPNYQGEDPADLGLDTEPEPAPPLNAAKSGPALVEADQKPLDPGKPSKNKAPVKKKKRNTGKGIKKEKGDIPPIDLSVDKKHPIKGA